MQRQEQRNAKRRLRAEHSKRSKQQQPQHEGQDSTSNRRQRTAESTTTHRANTAGGDGTGSLPTVIDWPAARQRRRTTVAAGFDVHAIHHVQWHADQCSHRLVDTCAWPQCNLSCPKVRNPFTGDEMDFIDLLMQFGLDLSGIADALGIDLATLQNMDHAELLRLLIQNAR
jgi:hypothetical protein